MIELRRNAITELEEVDITLRGLYASIEIMTIGAETMPNGQQIADMLNHIRKALQAARAELDDATGAVMQIRVTA